MKDEDKFDELGTEQEETSVPMEGQIGIEELYVREEEKSEEEFVSTPMEGQMSFEEFCSKPQQPTYQQNFETETEESFKFAPQQKAEQIFGEEYKSCEEIESDERTEENPQTFEKTSQTFEEKTQEDENVYEEENKKQESLSEENFVGNQERFDVVEEDLQTFEEDEDLNQNNEVNENQEDFIDNLITDNNEHLQNLNDFFADDKQESKSLSDKGEVEVDDDRAALDAFFKEENNPETSAGYNYEQEVENASKNETEANLGLENDKYFDESAKNVKNWQVENVDNDVNNEEENYIKNNQEKLNQNAYEEYVEENKDEVEEDFLNKENNADVLSEENSFDEDSEEKDEDDVFTSFIDQTNFEEVEEEIKNNDNIDDNSLLNTEPLHYVPQEDTSKLNNLIEETEEIENEDSTKDEVEDEMEISDKPEEEEDDILLDSEEDENSSNIASIIEKELKDINKTKTSTRKAIFENEETYNKIFENSTEVEEVDENPEDESYNEFLDSQFSENENNEEFKQKEQEERLSFDSTQKEKTFDLKKINEELENDASEDGQENNDKKEVETVSNEENKNTDSNEKLENIEETGAQKEVEEMNKDITDVDMDVGSDVFASNSVETASVNEKEVEVQQEKVYNENSGHDVVDGMLYKSLDSVLHESMIPYSEHVILDRALPRVEDGLKPVQRRILYSMLELGVTPDKPYRKSARIVGDCLGKYHPHGDSSVYQAMVRMAQPFNQNELLVSGHGNFGSVDGDGAAAMRYTEARLAPLAMELLRDLDKNTVKWGLNFDDTLKEPEILPGRFPNLLVNGAMGIAVGLATNIPPHNLAETIDGVVAYLNKPSISLKEMLKIIKGPDFPTGGYILNNSEIVQAYQTGKGKIYMRAKMHIESNGSDKRYIVITELPYQVNKSNLLQKIANYREENKYGFGDIHEIRDESDREGLRAVIRIKKDADIKTIYESLLKNTELQTTFGINMVAIANGKPKQMGLLDIISYYAEYQREVILRRSKYDLEQAKEREHILAGLIIAIKNIDAVVKIIKTSANTTEAKKRLREKFVLSEKQAQAILDMRLARLTSLEVYKLEEELKKLRELIKKLTAIVNSKKLQYEIVKEELLQIKKQYKSDRKTRMLRIEDGIKIAEEPKEPVNQKVILLKNALNNFKCVNTKQYNYAQKDVTENSSLYDTHVLKYETETTRTLLAFTNLGNCFKVDVKEFSETRYKDKGVPEKTMFKELTEGETVVAMFDFEDTKLEYNLMFLTKFGMIKKTPINEYALLKRYFQAMKLKDGDEILSIVKEPEKYNLVLVSKTGMVLNADSSDVPVQGRISGGVKGMMLGANDYCVGVSLAQNEAGEVLAVTNKGYAKRVLLANIDKMARYRKGLKYITFGKDNGTELVFANVVTTPYTLMCVDKDGSLHFRNSDLVPIETRAGKGKAVDKVKKNLTIVKSFQVDN